MIEQSLEFLKIGLMNNEDVMIVTDAMSIDSIQDKISREWKNDGHGDFDLQTMKQEGRLTLQHFKNGVCQMASLTFKTL